MENGNGHASPAEVDRAAEGEGPIYGIDWNSLKYGAYIGHRFRTPLDVARRDGKHPQKPPHANAWPVDPASLGDDVCPTEGGS